MVSKSEIEKFLESRGDFMQIDYLVSLLKREHPLDVKKYISLRLAGIYERKRMFSDAARVMDALAIMSIAFSEKIRFHIREAEFFARDGEFEKADRAMRKAMNQANSVEREEIYAVMKDFYKKLGEEYETQIKRNTATKIYERLLMMRMTDTEKKEIQERLIELYEKLGKFREAKRIEGLGKSIAKNF